MRVIDASSEDEKRNFVQKFLGTDMEGFDDLFLYGRKPDGWDWVGSLFNNSFNANRASLRFGVDTRDILSKPQSFAIHKPNL